jgi:tRNA (cmo5U34)-methyltransferase
LLSATSETTHSADASSVTVKQINIGEKMHQDEIKALFDKTAATYDKQWERMAPLRQAIHLLMEAIFAELPEKANILCVGAGTGAEMIQLAQTFPQWTFTAVDPSDAMLAVCRQRLGELGLSDRCTLHCGYLDTLEPTDAFDAATALLVSQFILDKTTRIQFFQSIANRLVPGGILVSSDLSADLALPADQALMAMWFRVMKVGGLAKNDIEKMRAAYHNDVAVLPATEVTHIIKSGGFEAPTSFFQSGLIHAWYGKKANGLAATD